jgi:hypothetical protein
MADTYLHNSQMVFIVTEIKRIVSNSTVKDKMNKIMSGNMNIDPDQPGKYIRTAIVCTKSDVRNLSFPLTTLQITDTN